MKDRDGGGGEDAPTESEWSAGEEGEVGITVGDRRSKQSQTGTGPSDGLPQQPLLMHISSDLKGMSILPMLTNAALSVIFG
jgi:hypothetical protein